MANFDSSYMQPRNTAFDLTVIQTAGKRGVMKPIENKPSLRVIAAMLVTVAVIGLSGLAMHAPTLSQSQVTLRSIQTEKATTFYADHRPTCAWFVEAVLPGTSDSDAAAKNLKAAAATL